MGWPRRIEDRIDLPGKERQGNKGKWSRKEEKSKREGGKLKMAGGKVTKWGEELFFSFFFFFFFLAFFFFFFFFFCFSLFKTTEICFGSNKMGISYRKKAFQDGKPEKNQEKLLCPLWKIFLWRNWAHNRLEFTLQQLFCFWLYIFSWDSVNDVMLKKIKVFLKSFTKSKVAYYAEEDL